MYKLHVKETQRCMRHAMIPKYILTPNLGFLPQIIYRYALSSTLLEQKPEVKVTVTWKQLVNRQGPRCIYIVSKVAKIRNRYNQVPHLTQDTNGKVTNSQKTPQTRAKRSALSQQVTTKYGFVCIVALRPKSTAMVIAGRSVHLTTLFPGQA